MKTIHINTASKNYDVVIGGGLIEKAAELLPHKKAATAAIVSDDNVAPLYCDKLENALKTIGLRVVRFVFHAGESSKNPDTLIELLTFLAESRLTRSDMLFALGGGVTGDMAGLAAALYMRGIPLVQLPTTLLSAVDSSVGGKTAIDLKNGKNLVGAFYQPNLVICDTAALDTLPSAEIANGNAEIVKYAAIRDASLLDIIHEPDRRDELIARCVSIKNDVVSEDEHDTGLRQLLNFGHTFGHAIEKLSNYSTPHGNAVAIGMVIITNACVKKGICPAETLDILVDALKKCGLPTSANYTAEEMFDTVLSDKKRASDHITLVIPEYFGNCVLKKCTLEETFDLLKTGLEEEI